VSLCPFSTRTQNSPALIRAFIERVVKFAEWVCRKILSVNGFGRLWLTWLGIIPSIHW